MADIDTDILDRPAAVEPETDDIQADAGRSPAKAGKTKSRRRTGAAHRMESWEQTGAHGGPVRAAHRMESWEQTDAHGGPVRVDRDMDTGELTVTPIAEA